MIGPSIYTLGLSLEQWRLADILLAAGLGLIGLWLVLWAVSRRPRSVARPSLTPAEQLERRRQTDGLHRDLEQVMMEIETLAKRLGNDLDHRAARVESLLQQADKKAAEIEQLLEQLRIAKQAADQPAPTPAAGPVAPKLARLASESRAAESRPVEQEDTAGDPPPISALVTPRPPVSMTPPSRVPPRAPAPLRAAVAPAAPAASASTATLDDPLARSVYRLADQGLQPIDIARKLNEQVGKVELILALRQV